MKQGRFIQFGILLSIVHRINSDRVLTSPRVTDWGSWGRFEYCPSGTFVTGMQLYTDPHHGVFKDDRSLTGIRLFCNSYGGTRDTSKVQSVIDDKGRWGKRYFCSGVMTGFQMRSEQYRSPFVDDTAANNLRIFCDSNPDHYIQGDGNVFGKWTKKQLCERNEVICGISTQIDRSDTWDRTGLNNVMMKCCSTPHPLQNCVPKTTWELVTSCNSASNHSKNCKFSRKVGISYSDGKSRMISLYERQGHTFKQLGPQLRSKFLTASKPNESKKNAAMKEDSKEYYWNFSPSYVWEPQASIASNLTAEEGHQISMYQIRGSCGKLQVWGTQLKKVEHAKMDSHQTRTTTYIDFNNDFNEVEFPDG